MKTLATIAAAVIGTVAATIAFHLIIYALLITAPQENADRVMLTVKEVCDYARNTINGESEEACGIAQDVSQTEYLCNHTAVDNYCWVEDKRGEL